MLFLHSDVQGHFFPHMHFWEFQQWMGFALILNMQEAILCVLPHSLYFPDSQCEPYHTTFFFLSFFLPSFLSFFLLQDVYTSLPQECFAFPYSDNDIFSLILGSHLCLWISVHLFLIKWNMVLISVPRFALCSPVQLYLVLLISFCSL